MKKIIACISLVFALSAGATALAADYTAEPGATQLTGIATENMNTILITKSDSSIVYANQADSGLGATMDCFFTDALEVGTYTIKMNNFEGNPTSKTVEVAAATDPTPQEIELTADTTRTINHGTVSTMIFVNDTVENAKSYTDVIIRKGNKQAKYSLADGTEYTTISGESITGISILLVQVPTEDVGNVSVALVAGE